MLCLGITGNLKAIAGANDAKKCQLSGLWTAVINMRHSSGFLDRVVVPGYSRTVRNPGSAWGYFAHRENSMI